MDWTVEVWLCLVICIVAKLFFSFWAYFVAIVALLSVSTYPGL